MNRLIALVGAAALVCAPLARAQDDDMPDGDVDIVEKPKKKEEKKPPAKKEEKKKDDKRKRDAPIDDDSDILTVPAEGKKAPPAKPADKPSDKPGAGSDDGDDDVGGRRIISGDAPATVLDDDEPPARPAPTKPTARPLASPIDDGPIEDEPEAPPAHATPGEEGGAAAAAAVTTVETKPPVPDQADDGTSGWVIAGAAGGGLVLLAGAVAGTWLLVDTLTPKTGALTVTPH
ncbi:MAG: hypothetical protein A2138_10215 [Deltaproteobacteria bacterium RBG_16_71_12]|nr:MAG: hypothetical protein A2138_10215 [Deltaproteobacteria bacterium RBG_16_71_12]